MDLDPVVHGMITVADPLFLRGPQPQVQKRQPIFLGEFFSENKLYRAGKGYVPPLDPPKDTNSALPNIAHEPITKTSKITCTKKNLKQLCLEKIM